jgi:integrase
LTRKQKKISKVGTSEAECRTFVEALRNKADARVQGLSLRSFKTIGEWLDAWLVSKRTEGKTAGTMRELEAIVRRYLKPVIGGLPFETLEKARPARQLFDRMKVAMHTGENALGRRLSQHAIRKSCTALQTALNDSVSRGYLETNHLLHMKKPRVVAEEPTCWTAEQAAAFLAHPDVARHRWRALFRLGLVSGMRQGELLALRWNAVCRRTATVTVRKSLENIDGDKREKETRTKRVRVIAIDAATLAALEEHRERMRAEGVDVETGPVFVSWLGNWIDRANLGRAWRRLVQRSGAPPCKPNNMRHTCASMLLRAGASVKAVAERLGDKDPAMTLRVYTHCIPNDQAAAASLAERLLNGNAANS